MKQFIFNNSFSILLSVLLTLITIVSGAFILIEKDPSKLSDTSDINTTYPSSNDENSINCSENWNCSEWSECSSSREQARTCSDLNACGTEKIKPSETRACTGGFVFEFKEPQLGPFDIEIRGDAQCQSDINGSLQILKERAPEYHADVKKYVGVIECGGDQFSTSFSSEVPPRIEIFPYTPKWSLEYIAGTIVHEMIHSKLYNDYLIENRPDFYDVPECIHKGLDRELEIVREQIEVMKRIGTNSNEIALKEEQLSNPPSVWEDLNCN